MLAHISSSKLRIYILRLTLFLGVISGCFQNVYSTSYKFKQSIADLDLKPTTKKRINMLELQEFSTDKKYWRDPICLRRKRSLYVSDQFVRQKFRLLEVELEDKFPSLYQTERKLIPELGNSFDVAKHGVKLGKSASSNWILFLDRLHFSELADQLSLQDINRYQFRRNRARDIPVSSPVSEKDIITNEDHF